MELTTKTCPHCQCAFQTKNNAKRYCSLKCRDHAQKGRSKCRPSGGWLKVEIACGICETKFFRTVEGGPNQRYCSQACKREAMRRSEAAHKERNPDAMKRYNQTRYANHGNDTLANRILKKYGLTKCCEVPGCGEGRVVDIAHKPAHRRNGVWRTMDVYERHMFWVLCPTHHALIDRGVCTPAELGLEK